MKLLLEVAVYNLIWPALMLPVLLLRGGTSYHAKGLFFYWLLITLTTWRKLSSDENNDAANGEARRVVWMVEKALGRVGARTWISGLPNSDEVRQEMTDDAQKAVSTIFLAGRLTLVRLPYAKANECS